MTLCLSQTVNTYTHDAKMLRENMEKGEKKLYINDDDIKTF